MNRSRVVMLGLAALAAIVAAFLVRGLLGGGTETSKAATQPAVVMADVLVASQPLQPGTQLTAGEVRWQKWPQSSVDSSFITKSGNTALADVVKDTVVRVPMVEGEPVSNAKVIHGKPVGLMAAMLTPGMRAVSIGISTESGAGGFILPNDRVDVLVTKQISSTPRQFKTRTLLSNVRVLAVDQTYKENSDQKVVLAKTATLELTPHQAEAVSRGQADGTISLSLRGLDDSNAKVSADAGDTSEVSVIRYGVSGHSAAAGGGE